MNVCQLWPRKLFAQISMRSLTRAIFLIACFCVIDHSITACPAGLIPPRCQLQCEPGYFGVNCSSTCPTTCTNYSCHPDSGFCYRCNIGFTGVNCSQKCPRGLFGQNCSRTCPPNCFKRQCDPFTGLCEKCVPGYEGLKCQTHYSHRSHGNQSVSDDTTAELQHNRYRKRVIYITTGIIFSILVLCSIALCAYLVMLKVTQDRMRKKHRDKTPIYKKPKFDLLSSSFRRWPGAPEGDYHEMLNADEECHNVAKENVQQCKNAVDARSSLKSFLLNSKRVPQSTNNISNERSAIDLVSTLSGKTVSLGEEDGMDSPELSNILRKNAPLSLENAANYSRDLFFKTYLPYQRFTRGPDSQETGITEERFLHTSVRPASFISLDRVKKYELNSANLKVIDESGKQTAEVTNTRRRSSTVEGDICMISRSEFARKDKHHKSKCVNQAACSSAGASSQIEKTAGAEAIHPGNLATANGPSDRKGRPYTLSSECGQVLVRSDENRRAEKRNGEAAMTAIIHENKSKVYGETTEPLIESGGFSSHLKKTLTRMLNISILSWPPGFRERVPKKQKTGDLKSDLLSNNSVESMKEAPMTLCPYSLDCDHQNDKGSMQICFTCRDTEPSEREHYVNLPVSERSPGDCSTLFTRNGINGDDMKLRKPKSTSEFQVNVADDSNKNSLSFRQLERLQTFSLSKVNRPTRVTKASEYISVLDRTSIYKGRYTILDQIKAYTSAERLHGMRKGIEQSASDCTDKPEKSAPNYTNDSCASSNCVTVNDTANNPRYCSGVKCSYVCAPEWSCNASNIITKHSFSGCHRSDSPVCSIPLTSTANSTQKNHLIGTYKHGSELENRAINCTLERCQIPLRACTDVQLMTESRPPELSHQSCNRLSHQSCNRLSHQSCNRLSHQSCNRLSHQLCNHKKLQSSSGTTAVVFTRISSSRRRSHKNKNNFQKSSNRTSDRTVACSFNALQARLKRKFLRIAFINHINKRHLPGRSTALIPKEVTETSSEDQLHDSDKGDWKRTTEKVPSLMDENPQGSSLGCDLADYVSLIPKSVITLTVKKTPSREVKAVYTQDLYSGIVPEPPPGYKKTQEETRSNKDKSTGDHLSCRKKQRNVWSIGGPRETNDDKVSQKHAASWGKRTPGEKHGNSRTLPAKEEHTPFSQDELEDGFDKNSQDADEDSSSNGIHDLKVQHALKSQHKKCKLGTFKEVSTSTETEKSFVQASMKPNNKVRKLKNTSLVPLLEESTTCESTVTTLTDAVHEYMAPSSFLDTLDTVSDSTFDVPGSSTSQSQEKFPEQLPAEDRTEKKMAGSVSEHKNTCDISQTYDRKEDKSSSPANSTKGNQAQQPPQVCKETEADCELVISSELKKDTTLQKDVAFSPALTVSIIEGVGSEVLDSESDDTWSIKANTQFYTLKDDISERFYDAIEGTSQKSHKESSRENMLKENVSAAANDPKNVHFEIDSSTFTEDGMNSHVNKPEEGVCMEFNISRAKKRKKLVCTVCGVAKAAFRISSNLDKQRSGSKTAQDTVKNIKKRSGFPEPEIHEFKLPISKDTDKITWARKRSSSSEGSFVSHSQNQKSDNCIAMSDLTNNEDNSTGVNGKNTDFKDVDPVQGTRDTIIDSDHYSSCFDFSES